MLVLVALVLGPPLVVGLHGLGIPIPVGIVATILLTAVLAWRRTYLLALPTRLAAARPVLGALWLVVLAAAIV